MILEIRGELDTHARVRAGEGVLTFNFANFVARVLNGAQAKIHWSCENKLSTYVNKTFGATVGDNLTD